MTEQRMRRWGLTLALAAAMAACGGGGSGAEGSEAAGDAAADDGVSMDEADIACGLPGFRAEALRLINERRAAGATCGARGSFAPVAAVGWDDRLAQAAYGHAREMADRDELSHTGGNGSSVGQRVTAAGYTWSAVAENISAGYGSVPAVIDGWMASDGHCANLMSPAYRHAALACAANSGSRYGRYWTLNLAAPR